MARPLLLGLALGSALTALAGTAQAQSLESALSQAYTPTRPSTRSAPPPAAYDENVPQALSGYRPTVEITGNASVQTTRASLGTFGGFTTNTGFPRGYGLQINQTLFNGFQTANSVRAAEQGVLGQREGLRNVEQNVLLDAVTAYMNVLRDAALLNLQKNNIRRAQRAAAPDAGPLQRRRGDAHGRRAGPRQPRGRPVPVCGPRRPS